LGRASWKQEAGAEIEEGSGFGGANEREAVLGVPAVRKFARRRRRGINWRAARGSPGCYSVWTELTGTKSPYEFVAEKSRA